MRKRRSDVLLVGGEAESTIVPIIVASNIRAYPVRANTIAVVGPTSDLWGMDGASLSKAATDMTTKAGSAAFVWLDPPAGVDPATVEAALRDVGLAVGRRPKAAVDAILAADVVSMPAASTQTIRGVVRELVAEVRLPLTNEDRLYLDEILDVALTGAGL